MYPRFYDQQDCCIKIKQPCLYVHLNISTNLSFENLLTNTLEHEKHMGVDVISNANIILFVLSRGCSRAISSMIIKLSISGLHLKEIFAKKTRSVNVILNLFQFPTFLKDSLFIFFNSRKRSG